MMKKKDKYKDPIPRNPGYVNQTKPTGSRIIYVQIEQECLVSERAKIPDLEQGFPV
jgi:hypothetical protein